MRLLSLYDVGGCARTGAKVGAAGTGDAGVSGVGAEAEGLDVVAHFAFLFFVFSWLF